MISITLANIGPNQSAWRPPVVYRPTKSEMFVDISRRVPIVASVLGNCLVKQRAF